MQVLSRLSMLTALPAVVYCDEGVRHSESGDDDTMQDFPGDLFEKAVLPVNWRVGQIFNFLQGWISLNAVIPQPVIPYDGQYGGLVLGLVQEALVTWAVSNGRDPDDLRDDIRNVGIWWARASKPDFCNDKTAWQLVGLTDAVATADTFDAALGADFAQKNPLFPGDQPLTQKDYTNFVRAVDAIVGLLLHQYFADVADGDGKWQGKTKEDWTQVIAKMFGRTYGDIDEVDSCGDSD